MATLDFAYRLSIMHTHHFVRHKKGIYKQIIQFISLALKMIQIQFLKLSLLFSFSCQIKIASH